MITKEKAIQRLKKEIAKYGTIYIAFDFDNTIFDYHNHGDDYSPIINLLKQCSDLGHKLILFTATSDEERLMMIRNKYKCKCRKIKAYNMDNVLQNTFDSVNEAASYYHFSPKSVIDCCKQRKYSNQEIIFRYA